MTLTIPNTFTQQTKAKASEVNANFDAIQAWADDLDLGGGSGSLVLGDIAGGTSAQLIVVSGAGVPTYRTVSGAVTFSNTGASAITYFEDDTGDTNLGAGTEAEVATVTPAAGTWKVTATGIVYNSAGFGAELYLFYGLGEENRSFVDVPGQGSRFNAPFVLQSIITTDGSTPITIQGGAYAFLSGTPKAAAMKIIGTRVA